MVRASWFRSAGGCSGGVGVGRLAPSVAVVMGLFALWVVGAGSAAAAPANCSPTASGITCAFTAQGETQFVVPQDVSSITASVVGAQGGPGDANGQSGGLGAKAVGSLAVSPGQKLYLEVNVLGGDGGRDDEGTLLGGVGGGESDVRLCPAVGACASGSTLNSRLLVAAGGGGTGAKIDGGVGGNAGTTGPGSKGADGTNSFSGRNGKGGTGATDVGPGAGGATCDESPAAPGADGALGGGAGGAGGSSNFHPWRAGWRWRRGMVRRRRGRRLHVHQ
jgi:hypothetical protein